MIILHKGKRCDTGEEVVGFITKMWGQYHIIIENNENTAYPVIRESIVPLYNSLDILDITKANKDEYINLLIDNYNLLDTCFKCVHRYLRSSNDFKDISINQQEVHVKLINSIRNLIKYYQCNLDEQCHTLTGLDCSSYADKNEIS